MQEAATAQKMNFEFRHFDTHDGLPSSEVHDALADADNYMWFATDRGVIRYNGIEFEQIPMEDKSVLKLYRDSKNRIWMASYPGKLYVYDPSTDRVTPYRFNNVIQGFPSLIVADIYVAENDDIYLSCSAISNFRAIKIDSSGKVEYLDNIRKSVLNTVEIEINQISQDELFSFYREVFDTNFRSDSVTIHVPLVLDLKKNGNRILRTTPLPILRGRKLHAEILKSGDVLFYTGNGIIRFARDGSYKLTKIDGEVLSVVEQDDGSFWLGILNGGLLHYDADFKEHSSLLQGQTVTGIAKDYRGGMWVTTLTSGVFYVGDLSMHTVEFAEQSEQKTVSVLAKDKYNNVWLGTRDGALFELQPDHGVRKYSLSLFELNGIDFDSSSQNLLISGYQFRLTNLAAIHSYAIGGRKAFVVNGGTNTIESDWGYLCASSSELFRYDFLSMKTRAVSSGLFRVDEIMSMPDHRVLLANLDGLWVLDSSGIHQYDSTSTVLTNRITSLAHIGNMIAFGTHASGIYLLKDKKLVQIDQSKGLASNTVSKIRKFGNSLWVATSKGLTQILVDLDNPERYHLRSLRISDGLVSDEINDVLVDSNRLYIGTNAGLSLYEHNDLIKVKKAVSYYIGKIFLNGQAVSRSGPLKIPGSNSQLRVVVDVLNYSHRTYSEIRYRFGKNGEWQSSSHREIILSAIPYGSYPIEIQVKSSEDADWEDRLLTVSVINPPPFWKTSWFYFIAGILLTTISFLIVYARNAGVRKAKQERVKLEKKAAEMELKALRAQMNPHFLFNSLNSIQYFITRKESRQAQYYLNRFAKLVRRILESSRTVFISLADEISILELYLEFEQLRFEEKFVYEITCDPALMQNKIRIPNMLIQPVVENAVKHAFPGNRTGKILVRFFSDQERLFCEVSDNGAGVSVNQSAMPPIGHKSLGLTLISEKLRTLSEMYQYKASVDFSALDKNRVGSSEGVTVLFSFPLEAPGSAAEDFPEIDSIT